VRCPTTDKPHSKNGSYIWDGQSGACQNWAIHEKPVSFKGNQEHRISAEDMRQKKLKAEAERKLRNDRAIKKAAFIMNNAKKAEHPYTIKKGFTDKHWVWNGLLVVPMRIDQKLVGCQLIDQDGNKRFLSGQITKGAEAIIDAKGRHIVCEGYATALSVRKALKSVHKRYTIHIAFSAANIIQIASNYPNCMIVADHDEVGIRTAKKTGKSFWVSPVESEDFNDFEMRVGATEAGKSLIAIGQ
jgi:putative DNA primase/helicase